MKPHASVPYEALPELSDAERIARASAFYEAIATRHSCRMFSDAPVPRAVIEQAILAGIDPGDDKQNDYVTESVGIATGFLIAALHAAGLATLTHTPNPMKFLNALCDRPGSEKPMMARVVGKVADSATIPLHATHKKPLDRIASWL